MLWTPAFGGQGNILVLAYHHQYKTSHLSMLIKINFEVAHLICPDCGGEIKIAIIIDRLQKDVVKKILNHCDLWTDSSPHDEQNLLEAETEFTEEVTIDLNIF